MRHRPNSLVLKHPGSVLGTAGLRGLDWARSPAVTLRLMRPPGARAKARRRPRLALPRSHNQRTHSIKIHLAIPPQPHGRKKLEPPWAAVFDSNG